MTSSTSLTVIPAFLLLSSIASGQGFEAGPEEGAKTELDPKRRLAEAEKLLPASSLKRLKEIRAMNVLTCGWSDRQGDLWFGSNRGVYRFDGETFTLLTETDGLSDNRVSAVLEDRHGVMWFGTAQGLSRYDCNAFTHIPLPWREIHGDWFAKLYPVLNPNHVSSLVETPDGTLWIGTAGAGAYRFDGEDFTPLLQETGKKYDDGQYHNWIPQIGLGSDGKLWFTSMSWGGVTSYDGTTMREFQVEDGLRDFSVRVAYPDSEGNIWFGYNGNRNSAVNRFDGKEFVDFDAANGHPHKHVSAIFEDRSGDLWFACGFDGVCIYDGNAFRSFSEEQGEAFKSIHFFLEDAEGRLWLGGGQGQLFRFDGKSLRDFSHEVPR